MELSDVKCRIEDLEIELEERKKDLEAFVAGKPIYHAIRDLRKRTAVETVREKARGTPATLIKSVIGAQTAEEEAVLEQVKMEFKAKADLIDAAKAQLNGWQSINKHFPET